MSDTMNNPNVGVWIFLDDSNLWIEGKKLRGGLMRNRFFKEDPRGRVNLRMLERFALNGRSLESAILYGSEPPAVQTYWRNAESKGWLVKEFHRSKHNKKEKEVDCAISVDITKTVYLTCADCDSKYDEGCRVIVLVSGDKDMRPAIDEVVNQEGKWKVEIIGYKHSMSFELVKMATTYPDIVSIRFLDSKFTFIEYDIKIDDIKDTDKYRYGCVFYNVKSVVSEEDLNIYLEELKWPYQRVWIYEAGNIRSYFVLFCQPDQEIENCPVDLAIDMNLRRLQNNSVLKCHCTKIISYQEYKKCADFQTISVLPISNKFEVLSEEDNETLSSLSSSEPPCLRNSIESIDQNLASSDECDETSDDDAISCDEKLAQMGSMRDWVGVHSDSKNRKYQRYTRYCEYGFSCRHRLKCRFNHTEKQKIFFKSGKQLTNIKSKLCRNSPGCPYGIQCLFAHSEIELFCGFCGQKGHARDTCTVDFTNGDSENNE